MQEYSELERKALEVFVTSTTSPIYACRADLPPEVFGAFGSFFSRNPKDLREHLLDAILGRIKGHEVEGAAQENLRKLAEGEFTSPAQALKSGVSKAQSFFREMYGKYSHKSIANVVWIPFVGTNVSQLFARQLAYDQLAFFIEQSTRFVKFDVENLYLDPHLMGSRHADLFVQTLSVAAETYTHFTNVAADHYGKELSFERWLASKTAHDDGIMRAEESRQRIAYRRELKAKAFDVARLLLPQAVKTNIAWILDARSTEFDIAAWKGHPLGEMRTSAELIEKAGGDIAPSLLKYTQENPYYAEQYQGFGGALNLDLPPQHLHKGADVISHDPDALNKTVAMLLMRTNRSGDFNRFYTYAHDELNFDEKIHVLRTVTAHRGNRDEWVDIEEAFDAIKIAVQIKTDIGAVRDLRRHQKWDRVEGHYTLDNGFYLPPIITEMGPQAVTLYSDVMGRAHDAEVVIRKDFPDAVEYLIPMAAFHPIVMSAGLDQFQYFAASRTVPQGHFSYREDAYNMAEAVCKVHPWIIGLQEYPSGKTIQEVVQDAPLKGILHLYIGETGLHT